MVVVPGLTLDALSTARLPDEMDLWTQTDPVPVGEHAARDALAIHERAILRIQVRQFNGSSPTLDHGMVAGHLRVAQHDVVSRRPTEPDREPVERIPHAVVFVVVVYEQPDFAPATARQHDHSGDPDRRDHQPWQPPTPPPRRAPL